ncbi:plasmid transfer operon, TraF, protein [Oceanospirillum multiglobuliferum]|uniref:Conjugal transfer protein TraF n=1 Tax=Oceanospirillum multiglobuliferum TaxID=64969 RepID=A0A1T4R3E4_9GAMM|nr:conjugal transfer protein TraF [Oceanospirillum multiglobuliferum]OPX55272.1 hypothetical protein BTE48_10100 [Oceanospirillum multiglobuliferum]SKA10416.1 plasmid transfer operon, TraF, protein [Oceanospirillum multiglobuliferum]
MKKHLLATAAIAALPIAAQAAMPIGSFGSATTLGQGANPQTLNSTRYNPAAGYLMIDHEAKEKLRFGYWSQFGGSIEFGQADNFKEDIDDLQKAIDDLGKNPNAQGVADAKTRFDAVLLKFGENGRIKFSGNVAVPGLPLAVHSETLGGTIVVDASVSALGRVSFLDAPLVDVSNTLRTRSAVYVKGASVVELGLGYSRPVFSNSGNFPGTLVLGASTKYYGAKLTKQVSGIDRDDGKSIGTLINDGLKDNSKSTSALGIDLGAVWQSDYYQVGVAAQNLNSPKFDYSSLDNNRDARNFSTEISLNETYTMDPQYTVSGAVFTKSKLWMITGSMDMVEVNDPVGDKVKNMQVAASFFPKNPVAPVARIGYQKNLAGEKLSALNFGLGLFRGVANIDLTYGLESVKVDGNTLPRQFGLQFSFEETF